MQRPAAPRRFSQAPERANREYGNSMRDAGSHAPRVMMIVDDHDHFRSALWHWIAELHTDLELIEAASGEEAIALASMQTIHIALMDIELPGMNGLEATRRIREMRPEVTVIIVSQHTEEAYVEQARIAGALAYISKDRVCQELMPVLDRALGSADELGAHHA